MIMQNLSAVPVIHTLQLHFWLWCIQAGLYGVMHSVAHMLVCALHTGHLIMLGTHVLFGFRAGYSTTG